MTANDESGRVAVVTGAAQGLGFGIASAMGIAGYTIAVLDIDGAAEAAARLQERGIAADGWACDVRDAEIVGSTIVDIAARLGPVHTLVNNAQVTRMGPIVTAVADDVHAVWESGFIGTLQLMQACHEYLVGSGGSVVNVASGAGLSAPANYGIYAATKEAIRTLSRVAATEWGPQGVRVNVICPSAKTEAFDHWARSHPEEAADRVGRIPLMRLGDAEHDVGAAVVFLAGDNARYITGTTLVVDGGVHHLR